MHIGEIQQAVSDATLRELTLFGSLAIDVNIKDNFLVRHNDQGQPRGAAASGWADLLYFISLPTTIYHSSFSPSAWFPLCR
jgi:hypothetical protein